jgi:hypothetical protein
MRLKKYATDFEFISLVRVFGVIGGGMYRHLGVVELH